LKAAMTELIKVPKGEELGDGAMLAVSALGRHIIVYRVGGTYFATDRRCTHQSADLMRGYFDQNVIECPVHQGRFNVCTGAALSAPASMPLRTYPVKIIDGVMFVEV
jgi:naphthalene 1,2-dioxygenase ferredoxin component